MSAEVTPEIVALEALINAIEEAPGTEQPALLEICNRWTSGSDNTLVDIMQVLHSMNSLAAELPAGGTRRTAQKTVEALNSIFSPARLSMSFVKFKQTVKTELFFVGNSIALFHDLRVDRSAFELNEPELVNAMDRLGVKFAGSNLSDSSKSVLLAQIELLKSSVKRFQEGRVGPFRDSAFSIIGRVVIQIQREAALKPDDKRELIDDVLRVYDLAEKAGGLLSLAGPPVVALLKHLP